MMKARLYSLLGLLVWRAAKWYVRRHTFAPRALVWALVGAATALRGRG